MATCNLEYDKIQTISGKGTSVDVVWKRQPSVEEDPKRPLSISGTYQTVNTIGMEKFAEFMGK